MLPAGAFVPPVSRQDRPRARLAKKLRFFEGLLQRAELIAGLHARLWVELYPLHLVAAHVLVGIGDAPTVIIDRRANEERLFHLGRTGAEFIDERHPRQALELRILQVL